MLGLCRITLDAQMERMQLVSLPVVRRRHLHFYSNATSVARPAEISQDAAPTACGSPLSVLEHSRNLQTAIKETREIVGH